MTKMTKEQIEKACVASNEKDRQELIEQKELAERPKVFINEADLVMFGVRRLLRGAQIIIRAKVCGHNGTFVVDTGAVDTHLSIDFVRKNNIRMANEKIKSACVGNDNGKKRFAYKSDKDVVYASVELPNLSKVENVKAGVFDESFNEVMKNYTCGVIDGIIGMDVLMRLRIVIDTAHGVLYTYGVDTSKAKMPILDGDSEKDEWYNLEDEEEDKE